MDHVLSTLSVYTVSHGVTFQHAYLQMYHHLLHTLVVQLAQSL